MNPKDYEKVASALDASTPGENSKSQVKRKTPKDSKPMIDRPTANTRPKSCNYGGGHFQLSPNGLYYYKEDEEGPPYWVCSAIYPVALTRDSKSGAWGRLLEWRDADNVHHRWAMPVELLQGDAIEVRRELARLGLDISPARTARDYLAAFLQIWPTTERARCVEKLGWHGRVYVTPTESVGQAEEIVVFQNAHALEPALSVAGTAALWRSSVAAMAMGNSRLVFSISVALAGPLCELASEDSGGFHLRGGSSTGKTTALKTAASVWGNPNIYPRLWRATANGLEGLAALHNDGLLILDELSQIDPREAGEAAYLLANGQGKTRSSQSGAPRQAARWRLLFLSAGEESLTALMARAGRKANAGQEIRLADIEADAGRGMGAFEVLNGQPSPAALALAIKDAANQHHGAVGMEWLRLLVNERGALPHQLEGKIREFVGRVVPPDAAGQVLRVARRFALVAVAGELATEYGLTGWKMGEADWAAKTCFDAWLDSFGGTGNKEERAILSQVQAFFEAHGASRFEDVETQGTQRIINRVGYVRKGANGGREYLVLPEAFRRELCSGFDVKVAIATLIKAGWLKPGNDGKSSQKPYLPGIGRPRCYVFSGPEVGGADAIEPAF